MKKTHVKPNFYSYILENIKSLCRDNGYNILVHGSINRDLDLICVPWVDNPTPELEMVQIMSEYITGFRKGKLYSDKDDSRIYSGYMHSILPGGRSNYVIEMARIGEWNNYEKDLQYYLDISFTPLKK